MTPTYSSHCWQSGAIPNASGLLRILQQCVILYHTPGTTASHLRSCHLWRWTHARSLITCKHPDSFTQTNTQTRTHVPPFCLTVRGASLPHTNKHSPTPPPPPPPPLDVRVFSLNFAWLLIWDADGTPACCPVPNTHIWGVKRIIHCFHHTTEVFELKEQLPSHS